MEMLPETRAILSEFYRPFNEMLVELTGDTIGKIPYTNVDMILCSLLFLCGLWLVDFTLSYD